jgi:glycosyltransferase involved in cell wall biosynthesis
VARRARILFIGDAASPLFRERVDPFLDRVEGLVLSLRAPADGWPHRRAGLVVLPRPSIPAAARRLRLHTLDLVVEVHDVVRRRFRPDLVHVHYLEPIVALALSTVRGPPIVATPMGGDLLEEQIPRGPILDRCLRTLLRRAALVTVKSDFLRRAAIERGARPERTVEVNWGVDVASFRPRAESAARERLGLPRSGAIVASPRQLRPLYNHAAVIDAAAALRRGGGPAARLVFARMDEDPAHRASLEERARERGVETLFLPPLPRERVPDLLAASDVVASLAASDGLPQTVVESIACGRPVVALDLEALAGIPLGAPELARVPGERGAPSPPALARALGDALSARAVLEAGPAWVARTHDRRASLARVAAEYERLLARRV